MTISAGNDTKARRRLVVLDPARTRGTDPEQDFTREVVRLAVSSGWTVDWHIDRDDQLSDAGGAKVWQTLGPTSPSDAAEHRAGFESGATQPAQFFAWHSRLEGIAGWLSARMEAADMWARSTWHQKNRRPRTAIAALAVWVIIRIYYKLQIATGWTLWAAREGGKLFAKHVFWPVLYPYLLEPAGNGIKSAYWRLVYPVLEFLYRTIKWIYWRVLFVFVIEPGHEIARKLYWKMLYPRFGGLRRLRTWVRDRARPRDGAENAHGGDGENDAKRDTAGLPAGVLREHAVFADFGVWMKEREKDQSLPDLVLLPAAEVWHFEALLGLVPGLELSRPLPVTLMAIPTHSPRVPNVPGLSDAATLVARLSSGSPFERISIVVAGEAGGNETGWHDIAVIPVDGMPEHSTIPAPHAVADLIEKIPDSDDKRQVSLALDAFGPLAVVSSALWGRVGSSAIFDSQVRTLIELGFRVARLYFDHWPHYGTVRASRIGNMIQEDQDQIRPHYHAVMERDEDRERLAALQSSSEFKSASSLKRMAMLLANARTETPDLARWLGATAQVAIVNHAPHVEATRKLIDAPVILETHDIFSHLLDVHGVPGFVPVEKDTMSLRLEEERAIWREVDCCVNLSASEQLEIADFARSAVYVRPICDRRAPSDRPWPQIAQENGISAKHASAGFFDIMLWGSWHNNNVKSIRWFLEEVRPKLERQGRWRILIAGRVLNGLGSYIARYPDIVCCNFVDRLEDVAMRSQVLVLPDREGTGISVKAMDVLSWGACFSSTQHGMREVEFGDLEPPVVETADELAADILQLLDDHEKREKRRELARQLYDLNYSRDAYIDAWRGMLQDVVPDAMARLEKSRQPDMLMDAHRESKYERPLAETAQAGPQGDVPPRLSVVVATYNRYDVLPDAIRSLLRQNAPSGFLEIIVVDNSPDQDLAAKVAARYREFPAVNYILEPVPGLSNARNVGLSAARAEFVAFIDDDAVADPNWAQEIVGAFEAFGGRAGIVGGRVLPRWITPQPAWLPDDLVKFLSVIDWGGRRRELEPDKWIVGCNIAFDKNALQAVGGFSRALGRIGQGQSLLSNEETEVADRIHGLGYVTVYTPEASVDHVIDPARLERRWFRRRSAWQAVSDFIKDSDEAASRIGQAGEHLRWSYRNRNPKLPLHFFYHTTESERTQQDVGLIYDLVLVMLAGGIREDGKANADQDTPLSLPPPATIDTEMSRDQDFETLPRLSVIVATRDRYDLLLQALASLQSQTLPREEIEIIVVDNSPDREKAAVFARRFRNDPQITFVIEERSGLSNARNRGLELARADYVAYIDDDAIAAPHWAAEILDAFGSSGNRTAIVGGQVRPHWINPRPDWLPDELLSYLSVIDWGQTRHKIKPTEWLVGCNLAFDKAALVSAGGFSKTLGRIGSDRALLSNEDNDVIAKITATGREAVYAPSADVEHVIDPGRLTREWFRRRAAWQAVSDFLHDPKKTTAFAPLAVENILQAHDGKERLPVTGIYPDTGNAEVFGREVALCYDIVVSLLTGGEEFDMSGNPASARSVRTRLRGRARQAVLANRQLAQIARKIPYRFR